MNSDLLTIKFATATSPKSRVEAREATWQQLVDKLQTPRVGEKWGPVFVPADMPSGPRQGQYVKAITILVFDVDNKGGDNKAIPEPLSLAEMAEVIRCKGLNSILYETHSSRPSHLRFRLLVQLAEPIPTHVYKQQAVEFAKRLGFYDYIDKSCLDLAHCYYLPAVDPEFVGIQQFVATYGEPLRIHDLFAGDQGKDLSAELDSQLFSKLFSSLAKVVSPQCTQSTKKFVQYKQPQAPDFPETDENAGKLKHALSYISSNVPHGKGEIIDDHGDFVDGYWLAIVWAIASLGWDSGEQVARDWSATSDRYIDEGFNAAWYAYYDKQEGGSITVNSLFRLAMEFGWVNSPFEVVEGGFIHEDADLEPIAAAASAEAAQGGPLGRLKGFSITGRSSDLRQQMLDDKFVLDQIAILGQWTNLYAAPNTGKTLLTLTMLRDQIRANVICGEQVFYVNADDTYRGMVEKLEIAESIGLQMLVPNQQGFVVSNIVDLMSDLAIANEAANVVIVLDTLKKFTDLMDKRVASQFGNIARGFVAAGGTLITLAHTNKHKDSQGKSIYSGTSDITDDGDCFYIIDKIGVDKGFGTERYTVEFTNDKNRGDVAGTVGFSFEKRVGETYADLLDSVKRLSSGEIERSKVAKEVQAELDDDADLIAAVADCLGAGINTKSAIVKKVRESTGDSNDRVRKLMAKRTGTFYELGHRWTVIKGANNAQFYQVLPPPSV